MPLREYQAKIESRALKYRGFLIFCEQRTGKTPLALSIAQKRAPAKLLIACPKVSIDVWKAHLVAFGPSTDPDQIQFDLPGCEIRILNYESISARKKLKALRKWGPQMVIADESHRLKGRNSKQSRALRLLGNDRTCKYRLALTGTPIESKIEDAWAQFDFADRSVFGDYSSFKDRYLVMGGFRGKQTVGVKNREEYEQKFHSRSARVLLEDVKPQKTDLAPDVLLEFDLQESAEAYESMEQKFQVEIQYARSWVRVKKVNPRTGEVRFIRTRKKRIVAPLVITQAMKLHQLAGGFITDSDKVIHRVGDEKLRAFGAWLLSRTETTPVVVFVRFIPELNRVFHLCQALGKTVQRVSGKHPFERFNSDVIVVQIRAGGVSIDLSRSDTVVFYTWNYSFIDYSQAMFRIRSYTSTRARYHFLIARGTVDEQLYEAATQKKNFSKMLVDKFSKEPRMTVRKKVRPTLQDSDRMISPEVLSRVKQAISTLPTDDEGANMSTEETNNETPEKKAVTPKPAKKAVKKPAKKTEAPKKKAQADSNPETLADICKRLKVDPRNARKKLRSEGLEVEGGRWVWKKGSQDVKKVEKLLSGSDK